MLPSGSALQGAPSVPQYRERSPPLGRWHVRPPGTVRGYRARSRCVRPDNSVDVYGYVAVIDQRRRPVMECPDGYPDCHGMHGSDYHAATPRCSDGSPLRYPSRAP
jgi:hypothetical protein